MIAISKRTNLVFCEYTHLSS